MLLREPLPGMGPPPPRDDPLPAGWRWVRLGDVCDVNPRRPPGLARSGDAPTTFVPMAAVDDRSGTIAAAEVRPFGEVRKGYSYFEEDDILFAKITPCMQNGKHAIARGLIGGFGFGTTEFHIVRPGPAVLTNWIHLYLRQHTTLDAAAKTFTGSVGQQRVPDSFLRALEMPLPPISEQERILDSLIDQLAVVDRARAAAEAQLAAADALPAAYLRALFDSPEVQRWPKRRLGDLLVLRKEVVHPRDRPTGHGIFVGLEHVESGTGVRIGSLDLDLSRLSGRKPRFYKGDVVYGYLRPYLNKVWMAEFDGLCSVDQYVYQVRTDLADAPFVAAFMRSPRYLDRAPVDASPGQLPRIRTQEVADVELHLPPLEEQRRLAARLAQRRATRDALSAALRRQLVAIEELPASLLRHAFMGRV